PPHRQQHHGRVRHATDHDDHDHHLDDDHHPARPLPVLRDQAPGLPADPERVGRGPVRLPHRDRALPAPALRSGRQEQRVPRRPHPSRAPDRTPDARAGRARTEPDRRQPVRHHQGGRGTPRPAPGTHPEEPDGAPSATGPDHRPLPVLQGEAIEGITEVPADPRRQGPRSARNRHGRPPEARGPVRACEQEQRGSDRAGSPVPPALLQDQGRPVRHRQLLHQQPVRHFWWIPDPPARAVRAVAQEPAADDHYDAHDDDHYHDLHHDLHHDHDHVDDHHHDRVDHHHDQHDYLDDRVDHHDHVDDHQHDNHHHADVQHRHVSGLLY